MFNKLIIFSMAVTLCSCASLSNEGANVLVVDTKVLLPKNCTFIEYIEGYGPQEELSSAFEAAEINLRNKAGKQRANYVVITKKSEIFLPGGAIIGGKAYSCKT